MDPWSGLLFALGFWLILAEGILPIAEITTAEPSQESQAGDSTASPP